MGKVLIIDDDKLLSMALARVVEETGHEGRYALTLKEGDRIVESDRFDVVFLDVRLPDGNGLELITKIRETESQPEVIIMTAAGDPAGAEMALEYGAWDYIEKTASIKNYLPTLKRVFQYRKENDGKMSYEGFKMGDIIGESPGIKRCKDLMAKAAHSRVNTLILGETGTGKELFANAIHENSECKQGNFVVVDCTSLPKNLVESVLFGHEKGAFTGADQTQDGLIKQADGGTLFLDEVGELSVDIQKKFLRVLEERKFRRVGGNKVFTSNFRLVAATNRNLEKMVKEDLFRSDLLYRMRSLTIKLPPLRERMEDVEEITRFHVKKFARIYGNRIKNVSQEFFKALSCYEWPGNVRELVNAIDVSAAMAADANTLFAKHLPLHIRIRLIRKNIGKCEESNSNLSPQPGKPGEKMPTLKAFREQNDGVYLRRLLEKTDGNINEAVKISGVSKSRLYELISKHNVN